MAVGKKSKQSVDKIRKAVFERDNEECVARGVSPCFGGLTVQHIYSRGMGSSNAYDSIDCLVTMCAYHNQLAEQDPTFARLCQEFGWSAPRWVHDRRYSWGLPTFFTDGWYLLQDGKRIPVTHDVAQATINDIYGKEDNDLGQSRR